MKYVECATQAELDKALANKKTDEIIVCTGGTIYNRLYVYGSAQVEACDSAQVRAYGSAQVEAYGSAQVKAYGSAQVEAYDSAQVEAYDSAQVKAYGSAQVRAYGSAQVRAYGSAQVEAYDSAQVKAYGSAQVKAYGSAQVRAYGSAQVKAYGSAQVEAYGSAQVRAYDSAQVKAYGSAQVKAYGSAQVEASKYVAVTRRANSRAKVTGGVIIEIPKLDTAKAWLDYYGIPVVRGVAVLFKAVDDNYGANHNGFKYLPGTTPEAPDWKPTKACGNGLHFCARPLIARDKYHPDATRYIACPVKAADLVVIDESKVKGPRVCKPCFEVDKHGDPIPVEAAA